jgi:DNA-directed RNA polymerase specialized sigma24 family protein
MGQFQIILERIRAGDSLAAEEFVQTYGQYVRQVVRARLRVIRMRRLADSSDFCQAVMASFLVRMRVGQYDLTSTTDLKRLLGRIAVNKVVDVARRPEFQHGMVAVSAPGLHGVEPVDRGPGPVTEVVWKDMIDAVRARLSHEERLISDLRTKGLSWNDVAQHVGEKPDAVRNRLNRAMKRIGHELGLEDLDDG